MMVVAVAGFVATLVLNAFFLDRYNDCGEVPIPGSASLHLPAGQVTISLHTVVIGSPKAVAKAKSRSSWAGTAMIAPVP